MADNPNETLVMLDGRQRAPLARLKPRYRCFLAHEEPDGTLVMRPAEVTPVASPLPAELDW